MAGTGRITGQNIALDFIFALLTRSIENDFKTSLTSDQIKTCAITIAI